MTLTRRGLLAATAGLATAAALIPAQQANAEAPCPLKFPTTRPFAVGVIGDSVTQRGSFASDISKTWVELLRTRIATQCPMGTDRLDSTTYWDAQNSTSLSSMSTTTAQAGYPSGCDLVIVGLGTNDCREQDSNGAWVYSASAVYANAQTVYNTAAARNPDAVLVGVGIWDQSLLSWAGPGGYPGSRVTRFDSLIGERCAEAGGIYISLADLWDYAPNRTPTGQPAFGGYTTDGFHPNDSGHAAIYGRVANWLRLP